MTSFKKMTLSTRASSQDRPCALSIFTILLLLALAQSIWAAPETLAQERWAAFAHGFSFGDDRPAPGQSAEEALQTKAERWQESGTIERWKATNAIDGHILLRYFDRDLYGGARDKTYDQTREDMLERFVIEMKEDAPNNARWVLVGHSQGGIAVRLLHEHIRDNHPEVNVEGVLEAV